MKSNFRTQRGGGDAHQTREEEGRISAELEIETDEDNSIQIHTLKVLEYL